MTADSREELSEREIWCKAWRLLQRHGADADRLVELEIERCLAAGDGDGATQWRQIAAAVDDLAR